MNYFERPVFDLAIDWSRLPSARFEYDLRALEIGFGPPAFAPLQEQVVHGFQFELLLATPGEIAGLEAFFDGVKGRLRGFWLPGPQVAFRIVGMGTVTAQTLTLDIASQGLAATWADHPARHVLFTKPGADPVAGEIQAVVDNGNGTERVSVGAVGVALDQGWQAWPLHYVRLARDVEEGTFEAEGVLTCTVRVVELPTEYVLAETGQRPVYGYHLWSEAGGAQQHWRFTSHALDVTLGGQDYEARRISHESLSRSTRAEREEVVLEALHEPDNPLSGLFPVRLATPLWVEILEANLADGLAPVTIFRGLALSTSVQGRKQTVRCASALDAFRGGVPGMVIQPRCNYRLFEPGTCGVSAAAYAVGVTVDTVAGRAVTVAGAGLAGKAANGFAEGWLETGAGAGLEIRTVLASGAESGGKVVLTLNGPLAFAGAGAAATLYPGCDGRDTTCSAKFANFAAWGGHRVPLRNLSLKALEISTGSGGKK